MIEIALSLGVIAFALIAIIGILPLGMAVQRDNREETIINQDANVLLDAIRNGEQGLDDLTNYVVAITNYQTWYPDGGSPKTIVHGYTYTNSTIGGVVPSPPYPITNGFRIVGLLSTPKYYTPPNLRHVGFYSNHVVAVVRALSGAASEKPPQSNLSVQEMAFAYRLIAEVVPYGYGTWTNANAQISPPNSSEWDFSWTNYLDPQLYSPTTNTPEIIKRFNYFRVATNLQADLNDVRLLFRWPARPNGGLGGGRQVFRSLAAGPLQSFPTNVLPTHYTLYFVQPKTFVKAQ
ncbi:MAG: hypothetical protein ABSF95_13040 [Verrucomicrobiota bacterium]|jgi:hypothetical protein